MSPAAAHSQSSSLSPSLTTGSPLPIAWDAELDTIDEAGPASPAWVLGAADRGHSVCRHRPFPSVPPLNLSSIVRERDKQTRNHARIVSVLSESGLAFSAGGDALVMGNLPPLLEKGRVEQVSSPHLRFRSGPGASSVPCDMALGAGHGRSWAREGSAGGPLSYIATMSSPRSSLASGYGADAMHIGVGLQGLL